MNPKVIIVGAGASGYAAACRLLEKGIKDIKILEAQNRIGGRVYSTEFAGSVIDLGAQWCHGEKDNLVYTMVEPLNLVEHSPYNLDDFLFVGHDGKFLDKDVSNKLKAISHKIENDGEALKNYEGSFGDYFIERYNDEVEKSMIDKSTAVQVMDWIHKFLNSVNASSSWFDVSAKGLLHYKECEGDLLMNWKNKGYRTIFSVLKKKIPDPSEELPVDEKIEFNKEVTKIVWEETGKEGVRVECKTGEKFVADYVILTVSLGVLKETYKDLFIPELPPSKINAIKGLSMGSVNKIFLKFKGKWWPSDTAGFSLLWPENSEIPKEFANGPGKDGKSWLESVYGFFTIPNNPDVLLGWVTGDLSPEIEKLPDETISAGCMYLLNKFLGSHYKISGLESILRSKWYTNPYFRGSYSYRSLETETRQTGASELAKPLNVAGKPTVLFAGEATHSHFYSTVHGAIESGFREADRIIQMVKFGALQRSRL